MVTLDNICPDIRLIMYIFVKKKKMSRWISILFVLILLNIQALAQNEPIRVEVQTDIDSDALR